LITPLLAAVQSQQKTIENQQLVIEDLIKRIGTLEKK
jgi:hypothetical protein